MVRRHDDELDDKADLELMSRFFSHYVSHVRCGCVGAGPAVHHATPPEVQTPDEVNDDRLYMEHGQLYHPKEDMPLPVHGSVGVWDMSFVRGSHRASGSPPADYIEITKHKHFCDKCDRDVRCLWGRPADCGVSSSPTLCDWHADRINAIGDVVMWAHIRGVYRIGVVLDASSSRVCTVLPLRAFFRQSWRGRDDAISHPFSSLRYVGHYGTLFNEHSDELPAQRWYRVVIEEENI